MENYEGLDEKLKYYAILAIIFHKNLFELFDWGCLSTNSSTNSLMQFFRFQLSSQKKFFLHKKNKFLVIFFSCYHSEDTLKKEVSMRVFFILFGLVNICINILFELGVWLLTMSLRHISHRTDFLLKSAWKHYSQ